MPQFCVCTAHIHDEEPCFGDGQVLGIGFGLRMGFGQCSCWSLFHGSGLTIFRGEGMTLGFSVTCFLYDMPE